MSKTILLTGGSGVVGQALLEKLTSATVICLMGQRPLHGSNIIAIPSDITQPNLGLSDELFRSLAHRVDAIVHSAAITDFTRPLEELRRTNVDGARHMVDFARLANAPLIHVSTAFVRARGGYTLNNYEASKLEAEAVVRARGVPAVIVRPSVVIGDARSGAICKFQGIHRIIRLMVRELLPVVPGSPRSFIDFVPQDSVAEAIVSLIDHATSEGEYWLTAGEGALRFQEGLEVVLASAAQALGRPLTRPRVMKPDAFDRLIRPVFLPAFPARQQRMFEEALDFVKYMNMDEAFPSSFATLHNSLGIAQLPDPRQTLARSVQYIMKQGKSTFGIPAAKGRVVNS